MKLIIAALTLITILVGGCATSQVPTSDPLYSTVRPTVIKPLPINTGAIYKSGYEVTLFEDVSAKNVGDLLTVILSESTNASKTASTKTQKDGQIDIAAPVLMGVPLTNNGNPLFSASIDANREFEGKGDTSQSNSLKGMITVTVTEVLGNGNMVIRGEKLLTLNQGVEHIRLSGVIRQEDVGPDNTVVSAKIANAKIIYGGQGVIAESNTKGWLQRIIDGPWWPF